MGLMQDYRPARPSKRTSAILTRGSVQVNAQNISYEASGEAESGTTLLFLHGSGGSAAVWQEQLSGLAGNARCLAVDLPGHGRSEGWGLSTVAEYREAVLGFLDALAIRWPVVVAGVCLGAAVAADMALNASERVAGLILGGISEGGRACRSIREAVSRGETPEEFIRGLFSDDVAWPLFSQRMKSWRETNPAVRAADLAAVSEYKLIGALRRLTHPALLVAGAKDFIATPAVAEETARGMANARTATLQRAGCLIMQEQPHQFNRLVGEFLAEMRPLLPTIPMQEMRLGGYRRF